MQLVEQHRIDKHDPRYSVIDEAAFKSKNLYNAANYEIRQAFIYEGKYLNYNEVDRRMQSHEAYKALPAKVTVFSGRLYGSRAKNVRSCVSKALKDCLKAEAADGTNRQNDQTPA